MSGGNNMESLLLCGDSSGESDNEEVDSVAQQRPQQHNMPAPSAASNSLQPPSTQSEISSRLKLLYSPASKTPKGTVTMPSPTATSAPPRPPISMQSPTTASASSGLAPRPSIPPSMGAPASRSVSGQQQPTSHQANMQQSTMVTHHQHQQQQQQQHQQPLQQPMRPLAPNRQALSVAPQQPNNDRFSQSSFAAPNPAEPTPLQQMKERQQQKAMAAGGARTGGHTSSLPPPAPLANNSMPPPQLQQQQPSHNMVSSSNNLQATNPGPNNPMGNNPSVASNNHAAVAAQNAAAEKSRFIMFARVLMKYLEQKDPAMNLKAKAVIKDCAERNKRQERGFESVTSSTRRSLRQVVGEAYWKRAEECLAHLQNRHREQRADQARTGQQQQQQQQQQPKHQHQHQQHVPHAPPVPSVVTAIAPKGIPPPAHRTTSNVPHGADAKQQGRMPQMSSASNSLPPPSSVMAPSQQQPTAASMSKPPRKPTPATTTAPQQPQQHPVSTTPVPQPNPAATAPANNSATSASSNKGGKKEAAAAAVKRARASPALSAATNASASAARKTPIATTQAATTTVTPTKQQAAPPPREYSELMEMVDHAVNYDLTTASLIFSSRNSAEIHLKEEQKKLLYGDGAVSEKKQQPSTYATTLPVELQGWSQRNLVTPRVAWAKVRLPEIQQYRQGRSLNTSAPVVGGGLLTLPSRLPNKTDESVASPQLTAHHKWTNELHAGEDMTLAILSQGAEIYVKTLVEKAMHCARQRQNLDGIRLWHQQHASATGGNSTVSNSNPPPLSLRLGCDVQRQVAQMQGNSAMICKRMEEALERQTRVSPNDRSLHQATLANASSMADLSLLPALATAVETADVTGKRSFEVYGGKDSDQPPFGRVPKQAKLQLVDFTNGMEIVSPILQASQRQGLDVVIPWS